MGRNPYKHLCGDVEEQSYISRLLKIAGYQDEIN